MKFTQPCKIRVEKAIEAQLQRECGGEKPKKADEGETDEEKAKREAEENAAAEKKAQEEREQEELERKAREAKAVMRMRLNLLDLETEDLDF